jgi:hypothetical protein
LIPWSCADWNGSAVNDHGELDRLMVSVELDHVDMGRSGSVRSHVIMDGVHLLPVITPGPLTARDHTAGTVRSTPAEPMKGLKPGQAIPYTPGSVTTG